MEKTQKKLGKIVWEKDGSNGLIGKIDGLFVAEIYRFRSDCYGVSIVFSRQDWNKDSLESAKRCCAAQLKRFVARNDELIKRITV